MIKIQGDIKANSLVMFFDREGIDEMIGYLNFIRNSDPSFHLTAGNELGEEPVDESLMVAGHIKIINLDRLQKGNDMEV